LRREAAPQRQRQRLGTPFVEVLFGEGGLWLSLAGSGASPGSGMRRANYFGARAIHKGNPSPRRRDDLVGGTKFARATVTAQ